jgi:hypothetical protein
VTRAFDALDRLTLALDELARSLESGRPDAVLAAEAPLAAAAGALSTADLDALAARPDVRAAVMNVRLAMQRCQTLGANAADIAAAIIPAGYGATGQRANAWSAPPTIVTRT